MRKLMKLIAFLGLAFFVMACSDDDSPVTPQSYIECERSIADGGCEGDFEGGRRTGKCYE